MATRKRSSSAAALTDLILEVFRVNGLLLTAGDRLVSRLGLTSARWQVLGAIAQGERPQPVAWVARDMGANRQNVQRIVNDLAKSGLVAFAPNAHHRRAPLVVLTDAGRDAFDEAMRLQGPWVNGLANGIVIADLQAAQRVVAALRRKLTDGGAARPE